MALYLKESYKIIIDRRRRSQTARARYRFNRSQLRIDVLGTIVGHGEDVRSWAGATAEHVVRWMDLPFESYFGRVQVALEWLVKMKYCERTVITDQAGRERYFYEPTSFGRKVAKKL